MSNNHTLNQKQTPFNSIVVEQESKESVKIQSPSESAPMLAAETDNKYNPTPFDREGKSSELNPHSHQEHQEVIVAENKSTPYQYKTQKLEEGITKLKRYNRNLDKSLKESRSEISKLQFELGRTKENNTILILVIIFIVLLFSFSFLLSARVTNWTLNEVKKHSSDNRGK